MSLFNFDELSLMSFFAVLVRFSVLFAVLPFVGDKIVPAPIKILLAVAASIALFPSLISSGTIKISQTAVWGATTGGIIGTVAMEVVLGLILGFVARLAFDSISLGANLIGNFMGFAMASSFDPHQESQTQVIAQLQSTLAMLLFLAIDGHHLMLRASLDSYRIVGMGGAGILTQSAGAASALGSRLVQITGEAIKFGILVASPVAISIFAVNVAFGVVSKAMPQLNVLVLSLAATALVGLGVLFLCMPELQGSFENIFSRSADWMERILVTVQLGK